MTRIDGFDQLLEDWLAAAAPHVPPDGLHDAVIVRARGARQRAGWSAALRAMLGGPTSRSAMGVARLAMIVVLMAAVSLVGLMLAAGVGRTPAPVPSAPPAPVMTGSPAPNASHAARPTASLEPTPPAPSAVARAFIKPFLYTIPAGSTLRLITGPNGADDSNAHDLYRFVEGPVADLRITTNPGSLQQDSDLRGIGVATSEDAWTHGCATFSGRLAVRSAPTAFLDDLRTISGAGIGPATSTTVDARPALTAVLTPATSKCQTDFHPGGHMNQMGHAYVRLNVPSRFYLVEVDDVTVVIDVWARTQDDLDAWLPVATQFVDSIHFVKAP